MFVGGRSYTKRGMSVGSTGLRYQPKLVTTPPMHRQGSCSCISSHHSTTTGPSWFMWDRFDANVYQNKQYRRAKVCSFLFAIAVFFVIVTVLIIAGLAVYMGALRIDTSKPELQFEGSLRILSGDMFTEDLVDKTSLRFQKKALKYEIMISKLYKKSILGGAFNLATVQGFQEGSLIVHFKIYLDRRKVIGNSIGNIEEIAKEVIVREARFLKSNTLMTFQIDENSIFVKRCMEDEPNLTSSHRRLNSHDSQPETLLKNKTLKIKKDMFLKTNSSPNNSLFTTESPEVDSFNNNYYFNEDEIPQVIKGSFKGEITPMREVSDKYSYKEINNTILRKNSTAVENNNHFDNNNYETLHREEILNLKQNLETPKIEVTTKDGKEFSKKVDTFKNSSQDIRRFYTLQESTEDVMNSTENYFVTSAVLKPTGTVIGIKINNNITFKENVKLNSSFDSQGKEYLGEQEQSSVYATSLFSLDITIPKYSTESYSFKTLGLQRKTTKIDQANSRTQIDSNVQLNKRIGEAIISYPHTNDPILSLGINITPIVGVYNSEIGKSVIQTRVGTKINNSTRITTDPIDLQTNTYNSRYGHNISSSISNGFEPDYLKKNIPLKIPTKDQITHSDNYYATQSNKTVIDDDEYTNIKNKSINPQILTTSTEEPWRPIIWDYQNKFGMNKNIEMSKGTAEIEDVLPRSVDISNSNETLQNEKPLNSTTYFTHRTIMSLDRILSENTDIIYKNDNLETKTINSSSQDSVTGLNFKFTYNPSSESPSNSEHNIKHSSVNNINVSKDSLYSTFTLPKLSLLQHFHNVDALLSPNSPPTNTDTHKLYLSKKNENNENIPDTVSTSILTKVASSIHDNLRTYNFTDELFLENHRNSSTLEYVAETSTPKSIISYILGLEINKSKNLDSLPNNSKVKPLLFISGEHVQQNNNVSLPSYTGQHLNEMKTHSAILSEETYQTQHKVNKTTALNHSIISKDNIILLSAFQDYPSSPIVTLLPVRSNSGIGRPLRPKPNLPLKSTQVKEEIKSEHIVLEEPNTSKKEFGDPNFHITMSKVDIPNIYSIFQVNDSIQNEMTQNRPNASINLNKNRSKIVETFQTIFSTTSSSILINNINKIYYNSSINSRTFNEPTVVNRIFTIKHKDTVHYNDTTPKHVPILKDSKALLNRTELEINQFHDKIIAGSQIETTEVFDQTGYSKNDATSGSKTTVNMPTEFKIVNCCNIQKNASIHKTKKLSMLETFKLLNSTSEEYEIPSTETPNTFVVDTTLFNSMFINNTFEFNETLPLALELPLNKVDNSFIGLLSNNMYTGELLDNVTERPREVTFLKFNSDNVNHTTEIKKNPNNSKNDTLGETYFDNINNNSVGNKSKHNHLSLSINLTKFKNGKNFPIQLQNISNSSEEIIYIKLPQINAMHYVLDPIVSADPLNLSSEETKMSQHVTIHREKNIKTRSRDYKNVEATLNTHYNNTQKLFSDSQSALSSSFKKESLDIDSPSTQETKSSEWKTGIYSNDFLEDTLEDSVIGLKKYDEVTNVYSNLEHYNAHVHTPNYQTIYPIYKRTSVELTRTQGSSIPLDYMDSKPTMNLQNINISQIKNSNERFFNINSIDYFLGSKQNSLQINHDINERFKGKVFLNNSNINTLYQYDNVSVNNMIAKFDNSNSIFSMKLNESKILKMIAKEENQKIELAISEKEIFSSTISSNMDSFIKNSNLSYSSVAVPNNKSKETFKEFRIIDSYEGKHFTFPTTTAESIPNVNVDISKNIFKRETVVGQESSLFMQEEVVKVLSKLANIYIGSSSKSADYRRQKKISEILVPFNNIFKNTCSTSYTEKDDMETSTLASDFIRDENLKSGNLNNITNFTTTVLSSMVFNISELPILTKAYHKISTEGLHESSTRMNPRENESIVIGADNFNITSEVCPSNSLHCGNGKCIPAMSRCNQLIDCENGIDERNCTCADYLRTQALTSKICDGVIDCLDYTDENNCEWCTPGQFVCPNSQVCVDKEQLCDGDKDCPFGDDEMRCITVSQHGDTPQEFTYHSQGFLMVRLKGKWGKLCIEHFDHFASKFRAYLQLSDLGLAACKALTYRDVDHAEVMVDYTNVSNMSSSNDTFYYELDHTSNINDKTSFRRSVSFHPTECLQKEVMYVTCENLECGVRPQARPRSRTSRIVGGANANPGAWPWQAALYKEGEFQCGAALISNRWLISAGHCFYRSLDDFWLARLGALRRRTNFPSPHEQLQPISYIILHPGYVDVGFINDISLLRMKNQVIFSDYIRPICLPQLGVELKDGRLCTVVGWGQLFEAGRVFPDTLQEVQLPLISTSECRKRTLFLSPYQITDNMFCAGFDRGGRDACLGDSGGPLMCQDKNGKWVLYGVTSNGFGCARANRPGVYTKVTNYASWLNAVIGEKSETFKGTMNDCNGYRCPLGECLPHKSVCNGFIECSDGSDEGGCL